MKHAIFSPSSAFRRIMCPASYALERKYACADEESSAHAKRGTALHKFICDALVSKELKESYIYESEDVTKAIHFAYETTIDIVNRLEKETKVQIVQSAEELFKMDFISSEVFGTCDFNAHAKNKLVVIDFKFGHGLKISATDNHQLNLYALGCIAKYKLFSTVKKLSLYIIQPMHDHISWSFIDITKDDIEAMVKYYRDALVLAKTKIGMQTYNVGAACTYCKAAAMCPAFANAVTNIADIHTKDIATVDTKTLAKIYDNKTIILNYLETIESYILKTLNEGKPFENYILNTKKGKSQWKKSAAGALQEILGDLAYSKKLITITEAKKHVEYNKLASLIEKKDVQFIDKKINFNLEEKEICQQIS